MMFLQKTPLIKMITFYSRFSMPVGIMSLAIVRALLLYYAGKYIAIIVNMVRLNEE